MVESLNRRYSTDLRDNGSVDHQIWYADSSIVYPVMAFFIMQVFPLPP